MTREVVHRGMASAIDDVLTSLISTLHRRHDFSMDSLHEVTHSLAIMLRYTRMRNDAMVRQVAHMMSDLQIAQEELRGYASRIDRLDAIVDRASEHTEIDTDAAEDPAWGELTLVRRVDVTS